MFENRHETSKESDEVHTVEHFMGNTTTTNGWFWYLVILIIQLMILYWIISFVVKKSVRSELYDFRSKTMSSF